MKWRYYISRKLQKRLISYDFILIDCWIVYNLFIKQIYFISLDIYQSYLSDNYYSYGGLSDPSTLYINDFPASSSILSLLSLFSLFT